MARRSNIFVPQTGIIYPSINAAAKALGVDPSNIGKALSGKRKSAGGYNFTRVDPSISSESLKFITEATDQSLSATQKKRQTKLREQTKAKKAARDKARGQAARMLQGTLKEANRLMGEYQSAGLSGVSNVIPELEQLQKLIGTKKGGGFNASFKNLSKFGLKELQALQAAINKQINRKGFKDLQDAAKKKQGVAYQLGISSEELDKYAESLPALWHILEMAENVQGKGYDRSLYNAVQAAMQGGMDPEDLQQILGDIEAAYKRYDDLEDSDNPEQARDDLDQEIEDLIKLFVEQAGELEVEDLWTDDDDDFIDLR